MTFCNYHSQFSPRRRAGPRDVDDAASRLLTVSDGTNAAAYSYVANSPLVDHIAFAHGGTTEMTTSNLYDYLNRLTRISSVASAQSVVNYQYQYNAANQRTAVTNVDSSYWAYGYDSLGQVTNAVKRWGDNSVVAGQQFGYGFDTIGNRRMTLAGGDQNGANQRLAGYTANNLNEYTSRTVPGAADVIGSATNTATVWVDQNAAYRKNNYFWLALSVTNGPGPVYQMVTTLAALTNGNPNNAWYGTTNIGHVFMPQTPESYGYDLDWNLLSDGRWSYGWDAENRLTNMTSLSGAPTASKFKLDFTYDYLGRRIQKIVSTNNGSGWVYSYTNRFVYDGWNVVAILDGGDNALYSFVWGLDLSGSPQGAGGVGGLLSMRVYGGANTGVYFYCYDGNGNVTTLVNAGNGTIAAQYEYGPFGELIRATGPLAFANPFLFQTEFYDWETGKYYWKNRYYDPGTGRWLSRDPMLSESPQLEEFADRYGYEEEEVAGAMVFGENNPISKTDMLGLWPSSSPFIGIVLGGIPLTHQNANARELGFLGDKLVLVDAATLNMDESAGAQDPENSFKHAMRNGTTRETDARARARANGFVRDNLSKAEQLLCSCGGADYLDALWYFGLALHTVQDSTSPAHNNKKSVNGVHEFRRWYGEWDLPNVLVHVVREDFDPKSPNSALDTATRDLWRYFQCQTTAPAFPADFFHYGVDTKHGTYQ
jgi:RHS repeat-associated protein